MVPDSLATVVAFLLLVAPGLLADILATRRRGDPPETTFRELSGTVLASLAYTLIAVILVAVAVFSSGVISWQGLNQFLSNGDALKRQPVLVSVILILISAVACFISWLHHLFLYKGNKAQVKSVSAWYRVFNVPRDDKTKIFVHLHLKNGYIYIGQLAGWTPDIKLEDRELSLAPPIRVIPPGESPSLVPDDWQRMVFRGDEIVTMAVHYRR